MVQQMLRGGGGEGGFFFIFVVADALTDIIMTARNAISLAFVVPGVNQIHRMCIGQVCLSYLSSGRGWKRKNVKRARGCGPQEKEGFGRCRCWIRTREHDK